MIELVWSEDAKDDYWKIIGYLETEWTGKEATRFIKKLDEVINVLMKQPLAFPSTDRSGIRMAVVVPQVILFYRINIYTIEIVRLWSVAQDPENLNI